MKLSSTQLEAFYAVARLRSFTRAAAHLHITQSALSQRILNLEAELATTLLIRDRSGIELTAVALELLKYCQLQDSFEEEFLGKVRSGSASELAGVVRVAGYSSVVRSLITPSLAGLLSAQPKVQLQTQTRELRDLLPLLRNGEADYVILDHRLEREGVEAITLGTEKYVLVAPKTGKTPDVYLDHDELDDTTRRYLKHAGKTTEKLTRHFLDDIYGIIDGVELGLGKAVIPRHLIRRNPGLRIEAPKLWLEVPVVLHFQKQPFYTRLHGAVIDAVVTGARQQLGT
jgi:DNA-binding transcriptional LysR family regulator